MHRYSPRGFGVAIDAMVHVAVDAQQVGSPRQSILVHWPIGSVPIRRSTDRRTRFVQALFLYRQIIQFRPKGLAHSSTGRLQTAPYLAIVAVVEGKLEVETHSSETAEARDEGAGAVHFQAGKAGDLGEVERSRGGCWSRQRPRLACHTLAAAKLTFGRMMFQAAEVRCSVWRISKQ